jgi:arylsulfatase A-like enzyme
MQKNVILITIDSLRRDSVGFLNPNCKLTPYLDKMASKSTVLANAFSAGGGTIYAMGSLMTSSFPIINVNDRNIRGWPTLAQSLKDRGYRTAAFHSNPWLSEPFGFDQGFDEFHYTVPAFPTEDVVDVGTLGQRIPEALNEFTNITIKDSPLWIRAGELFDEAARWIDKLEKNERYFLWVHPMDVHFPYTYPTSAMNRLNPSRILRYGFDFLIRYSHNPFIKTAGRNFSLIKEYNESIRYLDSALRNFCERFPDTLIVIMADHGDLFGEHDCFNHPGDLYNEIIRIPLLIYENGRPPKIIESNFSTMELGDIIRALSSGNDGTVIEPKIHDIFSIHVDYNKKIRRTSVVEGKWKLCVTEDIGKKSSFTRLYDIEKDPGEIRDLAQTYPDLLVDLMSIRNEIMRIAERQKLKLSMRKLALLIQKKSIN